MKALRFPRPLSALFLAAAAGLQPGPAPAADTVPPPRTHVLFMGTDLSVMHQKKLRRVEDVTGSEFKIRVDGHVILVPTRLAPINLHVDAEFKLSGLSVQLDQLQSGPAYSYGNDPMRKLEETNRNTSNVAQGRDLADSGLATSKANLAATLENTSHYSNQAQAAREVAAAERRLDASQRQLNASDFAMNSDLINVGAGANKATLANGSFDAMEVSFKVSSPVELDQPYVVILFAFHDPAAKPGVNGLVIHAQALESIDAKPRFVRVLRGGLPPGFQFVDCAVHIFNHGWEVATNRSDKRVALTHDEARQYLVTQHFGAHKGETLPATALRDPLLRASRPGLTVAQQTRTIYVRVGRDGVVRGIFADADCQLPLDEAATTAALGEVFFMPALEHGRPVDGVAPVRLAEL